MKSGLANENINPDLKRICEKEIDVDLSDMTYKEIAD